MKRSAVGGSGVSPDCKSARGESNLADSSFYQESIECIQEESETPPTESNLKDIDNILKSILMYQTFGTLSQRTTAKLKSSRRISLHKINDVASLELELEREKKAAKQQRLLSDIQELQESLDELEQYSRKNSVEIHGIPEDIGISTDEAVCKVAAAVGVQIVQDNIEISHCLYRKKGTKPIIAKFLNHKDTRQSYIKQEFNSGM